MRGYTIGKMAAKCSVGRDTIRYYERFGLMPKPERAISGYRIYRDEDVDRLNFIKTAQTLGFTLNEIGSLLSIRGSVSASAADVARLTEEKIQSLVAKLRQLRDIKKALVQLLDDCPINVPVSDCPIILYMSHRPDRQKSRSQTKTLAAALDR